MDHLERGHEVDHLGRAPADHRGRPPRPAARRPAAPPPAAGTAPRPGTAPRRVGAGGPPRATPPRRQPATARASSSAVVGDRDAHLPGPASGRAASGGTASRAAAVSSPPRSGCDTVGDVEHRVRRCATTVDRCERLTSGPRRSARRRGNWSGTAAGRRARAPASRRSTGAGRRRPSPGGRPGPGTGHRTGPQQHQLGDGWCPGTRRAAPPRNRARSPAPTSGTLAAPAGPRAPPGRRSPAPPARACGSVNASHQVQQQRRAAAAGRPRRGTGAVTGAPGPARQARRSAAIQPVDVPPDLVRVTRCSASSPARASTALGDRGRRQVDAAGRRPSARPRRAPAARRRPRRAAGRDGSSRAAARARRRARGVGVVGGDRRCDERSAVGRGTPPSAGRSARSRRRTRSASSPAALRVKVRPSTCPARPARSRPASTTRAAIVSVLPEPAPATTSSGASGASITAACSGVGRRQPEQLGPLSAAPIPAHAPTTRPSGRSGQLPVSPGTPGTGRSRIAATADRLTTVGDLVRPARAPTAARGRRGGPAGRAASTTSFGVPT